jgi:ribulose-5-phosphate 4-epimerase/fuculose-1-phosphate aldolase
MKEKNPLSDPRVDINQKRSDRSISKEDFCRFCHLLYHTRLVSGVGGNVSVRVVDGIFLTPTGYSLRDVTPDAVVKVNEEGKVLEGLSPTKDMDMHLSILSVRPGVNVVCHVHGAFIIAATAKVEPGADVLPPVTPGFVYYAHPIAMIPFIVPGSKEAAKAVIKHFSKESCHALLLQNHGLVTVGKNTREALNIAEEVDEVARIFVLTNGMPHSIASKDVTKIKEMKKKAFSMP